MFAGMRAQCTVLAGEEAGSEPARGMARRVAARLNASPMGVAAVRRTNWPNIGQAF
jgi:hypothetical protein